MFGTIFSIIHKGHSKIWGSRRGAAERLILVGCDAVTRLLDPEQVQPFKTCTTCLVTPCHILEHSQENAEETQNFREETICTTGSVMCDAMVHYNKDTLVNWYRSSITSYPPYLLHSCTELMFVCLT
jgi:phosphopantetheine adenylyltransferase